MAEYARKQATRWGYQSEKVDVPALGPSQGRLRFGDFDLDLRSGDLRKHGIRIKLQGQPFQVLQILIQRPGQVVTREELQKRIWPADTFVDFDQGLNNAVKRLREALADEAEKPRFIETLSKRGYRFIGSPREERTDLLVIGETAAPANEFAGQRAEPTNKVEAPNGSSQVEVFPLGDEARPSDGFSQGLATGVLLSAFVAAVFLFHSYSGQFGELLIQLGSRLEAKPAMHVLLSAPAPVLAAAPQADPQQPVASTIRKPIRFSPLEKPSFPLVGGAAQLRYVEFPPAVAAAEPAMTSLVTALAMSPVADGLDLTSVVEPIELPQPEGVNHGARDTRDAVSPYPSSSAGKYVDVGKFGDALRVNQVMDELGKLGFYGVIVHNRAFWTDSYHILLGPYTNEGELEIARPDLESRGFSPRILPSKSMRFSLPPMTLYGTDLTIGACIVTWELNSPEATVKFLKGRNIVATVKGRWEKRAFASKSNAVVSRDIGRGPETLLEFQWRDTDKVLVLDGSAFRFYFTRS